MSPTNQYGRWYCDGCKIVHKFSENLYHNHGKAWYCISTYPGNKLLIADAMRVRTTKDVCDICWLSDRIPTGALATLRLIKPHQQYTRPVPTLWFDGYVSRRDGWGDYCTLLFDGPYVLNDWLEALADNAQL